MQYKHISPNIYNIHADDYILALNITAGIQAKEKIDSDDLYYYQILTDHYIGSYYSHKSNKSLSYWELQQSSDICFFGL